MVQKIFTSKNFFSVFSRLEDFVWTEIFLKILNSNSSLSWCCLSKNCLYPDQAALSKRAGFAVWLREVCTFHRQCLLQISSDIKLLCSRPK